MSPFVDLRSDTVTRPSAAMLAAMTSAPVGDDVLGDDPTVAELERLAALTLGKGAGLFMPSGTMSNNAAIRAHTRPGDEILLDWDAHSVRYEVGAPSALSGVQTRTFRSRGGVPEPAEVAAALQPESLHTPGTALLVLENTHNVAGGTVIPLEVHRAVREVALAAGVPIHLDGARLFNAAIALGRPAIEIAECADSVTFCLSKGLGCPVGSVLCGDAEFIGRVRRVRKQFGGGMRQAGFLAAAGIWALGHQIGRLAEDHQRARRLAEALAAMRGARVDMATVQTNMVYFETTGPAAEVVARLAADGVSCMSMGPARVRLVTHCDVDDEGIERAIAALRRALA